MPRYLSLSWKVLLLLLAVMLLLLVGFTSLSILHMNDRFNAQQAQRKIQGQQYFTLYNQSAEQQLLTWLQSYIELQQVGQADDFNAFSQSLSQQVESLQLNFSLRQLVLYSGDGSVLFQNDNRPLPEQAADLLQQTLQTERPQSVLACQQYCNKLISLPLLNRNGDVAVLLLVTELTEVLYNLHRTLGLDVAVIRRRSDTVDEQRFTLLQASDEALIQALYRQVSGQLSFEQVRQHGAIVHLQQGQYYSHLLPLTSAAADSFWLLMLEDVTALVQDETRYKQRIIQLAAACFVVLSILIWLFSRRFSRRLLQLAAALPLLAQRRYAEFRHSSLQREPWLADELSTFNTSARTLGNQLEVLDQQLAQKTDSLQHMAMFDQLTGLANRNLLQSSLQQALADMPQHQCYVGLLFLDLDKFKTINNSRSHVVGDQLLIETARRLESIATEHDIVCRFGGDEFAVLLPRLQSPEQAEALARRVLALFEQPFILMQARLRLTASIGISYSNDATQNADELIRCADLAMYQAKAHGRNCTVVFNQQMSADLAARVQLEAELRQALLLQQFSLSLQPQVDLGTGKLSGFEALIRWQHPERGVVGPDEFIPVLEQAQLIVDVGYWVFDRACHYAVQLNAAGLVDIVIAVNMAADQFLHAKLPERFSQILRRYNLPAHQFELEITETTLISNFSDTLAMMHRLKALGFRFAIDDFGAGYSSLNYLKRMPVDVIKIDKSFVLGMLDSPQDCQIVLSTIAMVHKLGLQVVAEGVESFAMAELLQQHQCNFAQGYYFSRPLTEQQLPAFLELLVQGWPAALLKQPA